MAIFKRYKLTDKGTAEYRQDGTTISFRCSAGMWDGEAPMEIEVTAPNLAPVEPPRNAKPQKLDAAPKSKKAQKTPKGGAK